MVRQNTPVGSTLSPTVLFLSINTVLLYCLFAPAVIGAVAFCWVCGQVWDIAGYPKLNYLRREDFYVAMRLIAMAQVRRGIFCVLDCPYVCWRRVTKMHSLTR